MQFLILSGPFLSTGSYSFVDSTVVETEARPAPKGAVALKLLLTTSGTPCRIANEVDDNDDTFYTPLALQKGGI